MFNSWNNSNFFSSMAEAFAHVESQDVRATDINISRDYLTKIANCPEIRSYMHPGIHSQLDMSTESLWGANLHIVPGTRILRVLGEENFINSKTGQRYSSNVFGYLTGGLTILVKTRAPELEIFGPEENKAIETLREMISESEYRKYLKYGFILVKGAHENTYQIFRDKSHTKVWNNGKIIEEICVRIENRNCPPTDNVIAFKTMIEANEQEFKTFGNVYKMTKAA